MSDDAFRIPDLPAAPDALRDELQLRSKFDVRWSGLWKVMSLPDWKRRIRVRLLRSLQSCQPSDVELTNVFVPQGVAVTLNSVGQVKEFGSREWYFTYLCECDMVSTVLPTTAGAVTTAHPPTTWGPVTEAGAGTSTFGGSTIAPMTTTLPQDCGMECNDCAEGELSCWYYVDIDDMPSALAFLNGRHLVEYDKPYWNNCQWVELCPTETCPDANVKLYYGGGHFYVSAFCAAWCGIYWRYPILNGPICDPEETYTFYSCWDSGCPLLFPLDCGEMVDTPTCEVIDPRG